MNNNFCILILGKSGSGKSTLAEELSKCYGWNVLQSYTDRPKRFEGETGHRFVDTDTFNKTLKDMVAYNVFDRHQYGATQEQVDESQIYLVDIPGYFKLMKEYHGNKIFIPFYLDVDNNTLITRMSIRGDTKSMIRARREHDDLAFSTIWEVPHHTLSGKRPINEMAYDVKRVVDATLNNPQRMQKMLIEGQLEDAAKHISSIIETVSADPTFDVNEVCDVCEAPLYVVNGKENYIACILNYHLKHLPVHLTIDTLRGNITVVHDDMDVATNYPLSDNAICNIDALFDENN